MATIAWTEEAQRWLENIFEYIAADDSHAATRTVQGIYERAQLSHSEQVSCPRLCENTGSVLKFGARIAELLEISLVFVPPSLQRAGSFSGYGAG